MVNATENNRERIKFGTAVEVADYGRVVSAEKLNEINAGVKHDAGKPMMELLSASWVEGVAKVLTLGAKKYASHNWRKGILQSRLLGAAFRHLFAYLRGEDLDPETGLSHLYHASCELMFAAELRETRPDLDDRYKTPTPKTEIKMEHACL